MSTTHNYGACIKTLKGSKKNNIYILQPPYLHATTTHCPIGNHPKPDHPTPADRLRPLQHNDMMDNNEDKKLTVIFMKQNETL